MKNNKKGININITIPGDVHTGLKTKCALEGITIKDKIIELITYYTGKPIKPGGKQGDIFDRGLDKL